MDTFTFVGKIKTMNNTDTLTTRISEKGWEMSTVSFNMICPYKDDKGNEGSNVQLLKITGGKWAEGRGENKIFSFSKSEGKQKGQSLVIKWEDREKPEVIEMVAPFRKYSIDLGGDNKKQFVSDYDFTLALNAVINNPAYAEKNFEVSGDIEYSRSNTNGKWYTNYTPRNVKVVDDTTNGKSAGSITVYFTDCDVDEMGETRKAFDDKCLTENSVVMLHCFTKTYDRRSKSSVYCPIDVTIPADNVAKIALLKKIFSLEHPSDVKRIGMIVEYVRGSRKTDVIDMSSLTPEERENVEFGLCTLEDIAANRKEKAYAQKEEYIKFVKFSRNYTSGAVEEDGITYEDLTKIPFVEPKQLPAVNDDGTIDDSAANTDDDPLGLFGDM